MKKLTITDVNNILERETLYMTLTCCFKGPKSRCLLCPCLNNSPACSAVKAWGKARQKERISDTFAAPRPILPK